MKDNATLAPASVLFLRSRSVKDGASKTIILVDDNRRVLATMVRLVSRGGFVAAAFNSLGAALESVNASTAAPAAGIIDIYLERGRKGFELSDLMRERFGASIPIVMITGYPTVDLAPPYWAPSESDDESDGESHFLDERVPVYEKPVKSALLSAFLVRAAVSGHLRRSPLALREGVLAYAMQRRLTPQEARILAHLAAGSTRSSLPDDLELSKDTVKSQIRKMLEKCAVSGTDELIAALLRQISGADLAGVLAGSAVNSLALSR